MEVVVKIAGWAFLLLCGSGVFLWLLYESAALVPSVVERWRELFVNYSPAIRRRLAHHALRILQGHVLVRGTLNAKGELSVGMPELRLGTAREFLRRYRVKTPGIFPEFKSYMLEADRLERMMWDAEHATQVKRLKDLEEKIEDLSRRLAEHPYHLHKNSDDDPEYQHLKKQFDLASLEYHIMETELRQGGWV